MVIVRVRLFSHCKIKNDNALYQINKTFMYKIYKTFILSSFWYFYLYNIISIWISFRCYNQPLD